MLKLFFTWYIRPQDPKYWEHYSIDGIIVPLHNALRSAPIHRRVAMMARGIKKVFNLSATLLVDSQPFPVKKGVRGRVYTQRDTLLAQHMLGADILVHRDYPLLSYGESEWEGVIKKNVINASLALELGDRLGKPVMLVAHGWDVGTYEGVVRQFVDMGAKYIGIGSLLRLPRRRRCAVIRAVRRAAKNSVHVHAFGVFSNDLLGCLKKYVDSTDVSTPAKAAGMRELIVPAGRGLRRVKLSSPESLEVLRGLAQSTDPVERRLAADILGARAFVALKNSLALLNAYEIIKFVRGGGQGGTEDKVHTAGLG